MIIDIILILLGIMITLAFVKLFAGIIVGLLKAILNLATGIVDTITSLWK